MATLNAVIWSTARWASKNTWLARIILLSLFALSSLACLHLGIAFSWLADSPNEGLVGIGMALAGITAYFYPHKKDLKKKFKLRIKLDTALYSLSLLGWFWVGAQINLEAETGNSIKEQSHFALVSHTSSSDSKEKIREGEFNTRTKKKFVRKEVRRRLKSYMKKIKDGGRGVRSWPRGWQFLFFLGLALCTFLITILLAVLSCSLACSGNAALSTVVAILALATGLATIALIVYAFVSLFRDPIPRQKNGPREEINS